MSHIEIKTDSVKTTIWIDGKKIEGARNVMFRHEAGMAATISIELVAADVTLDGELIPELPEIFKPFYQRKDAALSANRATSDNS